MIDLAHTEHLIAEVELAPTPAERYVAAFRLAERVALAVIATSGRTQGRHDPWDLLAHRAPELGEWAAFFGYLAPRAGVVEAGAKGVVSDREADDLLRDLERFTADAARRVRRAAVREVS